MPELPEVETICRGIREHILGKTIESITVHGRPTFHGRILRLSQVRMKRVVEISRHGKSILIKLENVDSQGKVSWLRAHMGMTGQLLWEEGKKTLPPHTHLTFRFLGTTQELRYVDIRRFGSFEYLTQAPRFPGPDAWLAEEKDLISRLGQKKGFIKHALLNQAVIAGLGNIYVDESLYRAGIHPLAKLEKLSKEKLADFIRGMKELLKNSIQVGGTSFRNYVDVAGTKGGNGRHLVVYDRENENCPQGHPIRRSVVAGRGTYYCVICQKKGGRRNAKN